MASNNTGRVTQILGAVVDVQFEGELPFIQNALTTQIGNSNSLVPRSPSTAITMTGGSSWMLDACIASSMTMELVAVSFFGLSV